MQKFQVFTYALMIGALAFFNLKCEKTLLPVDSSKKIEYEQGNTEARVVIRIFDNYSRVPISGAKVSIIGVDSLLTDSNGAVVFDSIKVGNYMVSCVKDGFENIFDQLNLTIDSNSTTVPIVNQSTDYYYLAKKGAVVKGNLFYQKDGKYYAVDGAKVECRLSGLSFQNPLKVTSSSKGAYSFTDLPEYTNYTITVHPFSDGSVNFKQDSALTCSGKSSGDTIRAKDIKLQKFTDGNFIILSNNFETLTKTDSIVLDFSEAVDTDKVGADSIYVALGTGSESVRILTKNEWLNGKKRLVIKLFDGVWNPNEEYTLVIKKIVSATGKTLDNTDYISRTFSPIISGELGDIKNLRFISGAIDTNKVDYNTGSITLKWSQLANASGYQIYRKASSDSFWTQYGSRIDTFLTVTTTGSFNLGNQLKFIVLGKNSTGISSFNSAKILTLRDEIGPRITNSITGTSSTQYGFDRTGFFTDTILVQVSNLPEPMDTTHKPTLKVVEASYYNTTYSSMYGDSTYRVSSDKAFWTWTSTRSGIMNIVVDQNKNGSYDSLKIDFSSITDVAGNKADTKSGAGYINFFAMY